MFKVPNGSLGSGVRALLALPVFVVTVDEDKGYAVGASMSTLLLPGLPALDSGVEIGGCLGVAVVGSNRLAGSLSAISLAMEISFRNSDKNLVISGSISSKFLMLTSGHV